MLKKKMENLVLPKQEMDTYTFIAEQLVVNWHHVAEYYNMHPEARKQLTLEGVRSMLRKRTKQGLLEWIHLIERTPKFLYLTKDTYDKLSLPYNPDYVPRIVKENIHKNQINQVRLYLEKTYGHSIGWVSERKLRLGRVKRADGTYPHTADGMCYIEGKQTAIEVERSKKTRVRLDKIVLDLMTRYEQIIYFCTHSDTYSLIRDYLRDIDPEYQQFHIKDWSEVV